MKLLARLTLRSLIQNRWRSLATMIAITLSTLMALFFLFSLTIYLLGLILQVAI